ncbi:ATP-grasp fold amidoligase family protein [Bacillus paranthracis]|uniref:ATP-grasp fold amidoligase family protein n=1 Tax=Bacillus paranthracis TaxID=2026186 RepID=UPI00254E7D43|nr:ATP-grasp fold amidoligase family protein [Bacillus paranthracis]MDK7472870.1 ATP-grasp fold amidoligase family protein [Bacillus paranthracis]
MNEKIKYKMAKALSLFPDRQYCTLTFLLKNGRLPNLKQPTYFNDKLLKLKLTNRKSIMKKVVDKYEVRSYIKEKIGEEYLVPLIGVYSDPKEVDFENLPNKFALKLASGSQYNIICQDKTSLDWKESSEKLVKWLKLDPYMRTREWQYKDLPSRFVIEEYIEDSKGNTYDYKFWCFNGEPKLVQVDTDRFGEHKRSMFDIDFNGKPLDLKIIYDNSDKPIPKPKNYDVMVEIAKKLSKDFQFIRIDLYNLDGKIYFGEMTFHPDNCNGKFYPSEYEKIIGDMLSID